MNVLEELDLIESRAKNLYEDTRIVIANAKREIMNQRLDRHDVERLLEYTKNYSYDLDIPFNERGYIKYNVLHSWVLKNKGSRLKRLEKNMKKQLIQELNSSRD